MYHNYLIVNKMYSGQKRTRLIGDLSLVSSARLDRKTEHTRLRKAKDDKDDIICSNKYSKSISPGIKDVLDVLFPKFLLRDRGYTPRWLPFDYSAVHGFQDLIGTQYKPPVDGTINLTQVVNQEPRQIWIQYPHMSVMEYQMLCAKYKDLEYYSATQATVNRPTEINTGNTVNNTAWTTQRRQIAVNQYCVEYEFTNLSDIELFVELVVVAPKDVIVEQLAVTTATTGDYCYQNGSPLATLCLDHARMHPPANAILPLDNNETNFGLNNYTSLNLTGSATSIRGYKIESYHRLFHERFSVCDKKFVKLEPGQKLIYDLVIPSFQRDSDFTADLTSFYTAQGIQQSIIPTFFKKSRFLMVRAWSESVVDVVGQNMTYGDGALGVMCKKRVNIRAMPQNRDFVTVQANRNDSNYDLDWAGQHATAQRINGQDKSKQAFINEEADVPGVYDTAET